MKYFFSILLFLGLVSCEKTPSEIQAEYESYESREKSIFLNSMVYIKDDRTGLCFAYIRGGNGSHTFILVPEENVSKYLAK